MKFFTSYFLLFVEVNIIQAKSTRNPNFHGYSINCGPPFFGCFDGVCIPMKWVCDGSDDCTHGEDEYCKETAISPKEEEKSQQSLIKRSSMDKSTNLKSSLYEDALKLINNTHKALDKMLNSKSEHGSEQTTNIRKRNNEAFISDINSSTEISQVTFSSTEETTFISIVEENSDALLATDLDNSTTVTSSESVPATQTSISTEKDIEIMNTTTSALPSTPTATATATATTTATATATTTEPEETTEISAKKESTATTAAITTTATTEAETTTGTATTKETTEETETTSTSTTKEATTTIIAETTETTTNTTARTTKPAETITTTESCQTDIEDEVQILSDKINILMETLIQIQEQLNETECSKPCSSTNSTNSVFPPPTSPTPTTPPPIMETEDLPAIGKVTCPYHFQNMDGVCIYVQIYPPVSWFEAANLCNSQDSHLVHVKTKKFFEKLLKQLNFDRMRVYDFWVGATNQNINGQWSWSDGSFVTGFDIWGLNANKADILLDYHHKLHQCGFLDGKLYSYLNGASCHEPKGFICTSETPFLY